MGQIFKGREIDFNIKGKKNHNKINYRICIRQASFRKKKTLLEFAEIGYILLTENNVDLEKAIVKIVASAERIVMMRRIFNDKDF